MHYTKSDKTVSTSTQKRIGKIVGIKTKCEIGKTHQVSHDKCHRLENRIEKPVYKKFICYVYLIGAFLYRLLSRNGSSFLWNQGEF